MTHNESIQADYKKDSIIVTVRRDGWMIWERSVPKSDIKRLRQIVHESNLPVLLRHEIRHRLDDIEDQIIDEGIDENYVRLWTREDWLFWIFFVVFFGVFIGLEIWFLIK